MEYKGKLYAKIGNKYLEISHTDEFEAKELSIVALKDSLFMRNELIQNLDKDVARLTNENDLMQEHLMHNEAEFIPLREKFQRLQDNIIEYQKQIEELKDKYNKCMQNNIV